MGGGDYDSAPAALLHTGNGQANGMKHCRQVDCHDSVHRSGGKSSIGLVCLNTRIVDQNIHSTQFCLSIRHQGSNAGGGGTNRLDCNEP